MGDLPKPPDDAAWSEVERSFFAGAPPEASEPAGEPPRIADVFPVLAPKRPRRAVFARLRPVAAAAWRGASAGVRGATAAWRGMTAAWRGTTATLRGATRGLVAASTRSWRQARAGAASMIAALSLGRVDRRRAGFALLSVVAGFSVGIVAFRTGASMRVATARTEGAPIYGPPLALAAPVAALVPAAPVAASPASRATPRSVVPSPSENRPRVAEASSRRPHTQRTAVPAYSSTKTRPLVTAFEDRQTYWAREGKSAAPSPASRTLFSR
jgi:hypothetical protein